MVSSLVGPLDELQARAGKNIAKTGFFPLTRIIEPEKIKVPDVQAHINGCGRRQRIGLDNRIRRAFDAALHTQRAQQVPHKRRFARPQIALQFNQRIDYRRLTRQRLREGSRGSFV